MKQFYILLMVLLYAPFNADAQIFGNSLYDSDLNYQGNYIVAFKIETGPGDSGTFTHIGLNNSASAGDCQIKVGLYDHNAASNKPGNLLASEYIPSPTPDNFNEHPLDPAPALLPSTVYWIAVRTNCSYGSSLVVDVNWEMLPVHYKSRTFGSTWPSPYTGTTSYAGQMAALYAVGNGQVLPVELLDFNVRMRNDQPLLEWVATNEVNNDGWFIQRSTNGFTWETIDWVDGKGNSKEKTSYQYTDEHPMYNRVFYRLEQTDYDGTIAHSEVKSIQIDRTEVTIFPNPVKNYLRIEGENLGESFEIYNDLRALQMSGQFVEDQQIDVSNLSSGSYTIRLADANLSLRFIKI